ncbi:hypothetical protein [Burkholderia pseudomallei]|nr:hypothetical protein [Burkholderia pseudomallei]
MLDSTGEIHVYSDAHLNPLRLALSGHRVANRLRLAILAEKHM